MKKFDENEIKEMLYKTEHTEPETVPEVREAEIKRVKRFRTPYRIVAAVAAVVIIATAVLLPLLTNEPNRNLPVGNESSSAESISGESADESKDPPSREIADYLPENQHISVPVSPWSDGRLSLLSLTYENTPKPAPLSARRPSAAVLLAGSETVKNITVTQQANTKRGKSANPSLLDITYTATGEHEQCYGVYLDTGTGKVICLQHMILAAMDKSVLLEVFTRECKAYLATENSSGFDRYEELYDGKYFSLEELGLDWDKEYSGAQLKELTDEINKNLKHIKNNIKTKILEYGANRDYCMFFLISSSYLYDVKDTDGGNGNGIYIYDIKNNKVSGDIDLDTLTGFSGHTPNITASSDYSVIVYGGYGRNLNNYECPRVAEVTRENGDFAVGSYDISKDYLTVGAIELSPNEIYAYYAGYDKNANTEEEKNRWVFHNIYTKQTVYLPGNFVRFALNDSVVVMELDGVYSAYEAATGEAFDDISSIPEYEKYVYTSENRSLRRTDIFSGEKALFAENVSAYSVCSGGAFVYFYSAGNAFITCVDNVKGERTEVNISKDFASQASAATGNVTYSLLTDKSGDNAVICYFTEDIYVLGSAYLDECVTIDEYVRAFSFQLWDSGTTLGGKRLTLSGLTKTRLAHLTGVLLEDEFLAAYSDGVIEQSESDALKAAYEKLIGDYIEVRPDGTVLICETEFINRVGTVFIGENDFFERLIQKSAGMRPAEEYFYETSLSPLVSDYVKTVDADYETVNNAVKRYVTEKYDGKTSQDGDLQFYPADGYLDDIKARIFLLCAANKGNPQSALEDGDEIKAGYVEWLKVNVDSFAKLWSSDSGDFVSDDVRGDIAEVLSRLTPELNGNISYDNCAVEAKLLFQVATYEELYAGVEGSVFDAFSVLRGSQNEYYFYADGMVAELSKDDVMKIKGLA